ncbi:hypothetical protein [Paenibacillus sp. B01]|uniref:hypothetical protein n=1 Tax=Paenibacillus sp. B01 TaxID=2660554 RepID=UPI00129A8A1C|nr:hypothetical protein [Paenibacillus sp. B01]QGG54987.1 hypothetical protein GE073_04900 [Paenibacillus sp. B01]
MHVRIARKNDQWVSWSTIVFDIEAIKKAAGRKRLAAAASRLSAGCISWLAAGSARWQFPSGRPIQAWRSLGRLRPVWSPLDGIGLEE